jgi:alpha-1,3-rhamnosyl/mannosyltransferase
MLACGGAVVASTSTAIQEVIGGHALLLDPADIAGWRDAMRSVASFPDAFASFRRSGMAHARSFTWEVAARKALAVYRQAMEITTVPEVVSPVRQAA